MKTLRKRNCGTPIKIEAPSPAQDVLSDHGEIFSCGGVYLGLNRQAPAIADHFEILHLPNHHKETLVLNNQKIYRTPGEPNHVGNLTPQETSTPEEALRRFFKESLN